MIVKICGTSGSGKSTVMNRVVESLKLEPYFFQGNVNRVPLYSFSEEVVVLGHYNGVTGGADNIPDKTGYRGGPGIFKLINEVQERHPGAHVLVEGVIWAEDTKWSLQLEDLRCVFLTTPGRVCLSRIVKRRALKGNDKPLNPDNTLKRIATIERAYVKLKEAGVHCVRCNSLQAPRVIQSWLGLGE